MGQWNDTNEPIAYLITFRTYGTWLHGDKRGSVDKFHNKHGESRNVPSEKRHDFHAMHLKSEPFLLNANARKLVEKAIREVCIHNSWNLFALNIRTNHVHIVLDAIATSSKVLNTCKSYSTRALRSAGEWKFEHTPWVDKGSKRNLWNEHHISAACDYVIHGQGDRLPEFD